MLSESVRTESTERTEECSLTRESFATSELLYLIAEETQQELHDHSRCQGQLFMKTLLMCLPQKSRTEY